jgi:CheY-like chemotaxis protein
MWGKIYIQGTGNPWLSFALTSLCVLLIIAAAVFMALKRQNPKLGAAPIKGAPASPPTAMVDITAEAMIGAPRKINIHEFIAPIERSWRQFMSEKDITFTVFCDPRITQPIVIQADILSGLVNSLIGRACCTTDKGRIHMHVTVKTPPDTPDVPQLEIVVADTGSGLIASKALTRAGVEYDFNVQDIKPKIQELSGRLVHKSRLGRGAEFILTCPAPQSALKRPKRTSSTAAQAMTEIKLEDYYTRDVNEVAAEFEAQIIARQAENQRARASHDDISRSESRNESLRAKAGIIAELTGLNVLVVEDIESNRDAIRALLTPLNPKLIYAATGREAINALKTHIFDYVLMDIHMPGLSGIETTQIIRERELGAFHIPVIGLTADTTSQTTQKALAAGFDLVLAKPVTAAALFKAIHSSRAAHPNYQNYAETARTKASYAG